MSRLTINSVARETMVEVRAYFGTFATLTAAFVFLPALAFGLLLPAEVQRVRMPAPGVLPHFPAWFVPAVLVAITLQSLVTLTIAAIAGDPARVPHETVGQTLTRMLPALLRYLGALVLLFLAYIVLALPFGLIITFAVGALAAIGGGTNAGTANTAVGIAILILLPTLLWVGARLSPMIGVFAIERTSPLAGIRRAWRLSAGSAWRIVLLVILVSFAGIVVAFAAQGVAVAFGSAMVIAGSPTVARIALGTVTGAVNGLLFVLFSAGLGVIYRQLAER